MAMAPNSWTVDRPVDRLVDRVFCIVSLVDHRLRVLLPGNWARGPLDRPVDRYVDRYVDRVFCKVFGRGP